MEIIIGYSASATAVACSILSAHLVAKPTRRYIHHWLLAMFFGAYALRTALLLLQLHFSYTLLIETRVALGLLFFSSGYLFCRSIARPNQRLSISDSVHLIPSVSAFILPVFVYRGILDLLIIATEFVYIIMITMLIRVNTQTTNQSQRTKTKVTHWLQLFLFIYAALFIADILIASQMGNNNDISQSLLFTAGVVACMVFVGLVSYRSLDGESMVAWLIRSSDDTFHSPTENLQTLAKDINVYISSPPIYCDEDMSIIKFAHNMGLSARKISEVINAELGCTFPELLSRTRIEKAQELLRAPENKKTKVLNIALDVGFRSKSNFNKEFKKITGHTPSEYRRKYQG